MQEADSFQGILLKTLRMGGGVIVKYVHLKGIKVSRIELEGTFLTPGRGKLILNSKRRQRPCLYTWVLFVIY